MMQDSQMEKQMHEQPKWNFNLTLFCVNSPSVLNLNLFWTAVYNELIWPMWCDKIMIKVFKKEFHRGFSQSALMMELLAVRGHC